MAHAIEFITRNHLTLNCDPEFCKISFEIVEEIRAGGLSDGECVLFITNSLVCNLKLG